MYGHLTWRVVYTVAVNKKFTFRIHSTIVLLCQPSSKHGVKFVYASIVRIVSMVSRRTKNLNVYNNCIVYETLLTLLYILGLQSCPMSIAARESEIHSEIDRLSPSPAQQTYSTWNQRISGRFFLILGYVLFTGLCYVPVYILRR